MVNPTTLAAKINHALKAESAKLYSPYAPANARAYGCSIEDCPNTAYAGGLCNAHYIRKRAGRDMRAPLRNRKRQAKCAECGAPVDGRGGWQLCKSHYRARRRRIIREVCINELGGCCLHCGGVFPHPVYDFHHLCGDDKLFAPSNAFEAASIRAVAEEVAKCVLLCANCHRIEHHGDIPKVSG